MRSIVTQVLSLCAAGALTASAMAANSVGTGFEGPDFTVGALNGQPASSPAADQWLVSNSGADASANVSTANPNGGTQHVRLVPLAAQSLTKTGFFSPIINITGGTPTVTKFDVAINGVVPGPDTGGSEYTILLADRANSRVAAEMVLSYTGDILVDDNGALLTDTGTDWTTGAYQTFEIDVNTTPGKILYKRNGSTFYTGDLITALNNGSNTVDQIQFISDNFGDPLSETADFDNVGIAVPEPASLSLLGGVGLMLMRRRK